MIYNPKNHPFINELNLIEGNHQQIQELKIIKTTEIQAEEKVKTAKEMMEEYFKNNKHLIIQ